MTTSHRRLILLFVLMVLALSGCNPVPGDGAPAAGGEQVAQATEAPAAEPTPTVMEEPTATAEPTSDAGTRTDRGCDRAAARLQRRDYVPQTRRPLRSARAIPQVIEFFAFW